MTKVVALIVLVFIVVAALLRILAGKSRARDRYIQRDYKKFKRLDAQLEQEKTAIEPPARHQHPDAMP